MSILWPSTCTWITFWPWILEPTWTIWRDEAYFSGLLREAYPDEELDEPNKNCYICHQKLAWGYGHKANSPAGNSPTLDRMNNETVTTLSNIATEMHIPSF